MGKVKEMVSEVAERLYPGDVTAQDEYFEKAVTGEITMTDVLMEFKKQRGIHY
jgi:hypothetical protein